MEEELFQAKQKLFFFQMLLLTCEGDAGTDPCYVLVLQVKVNTLKMLPFLLFIQNHFAHNKHV